MSHQRGWLSSWISMRRFAHVFRPYVCEQKKLILIALSSLLAGTLMRILEPWPLKFVVDRITEHGANRARVSIQAVNQLDTGTLLIASAVALVLIAAMRAATAYASTIGFALAGNRALTQIRAALFRHLQNLSLSFHGKSRSGDIVVRVIGDVGIVKEVTITALLPLLGSALILVGMFGVMFWLDAQLAMIAAATLPLLALAMVRRGRRIRHAAKKTRRQEGALAATASESFSAIKTVQTLSLEGRFLGAFSRQNEASLTDGVKVKRLSAGLERGVDILIAIATACILWAGANRVLAGKLSAGELLVFLFYLKGAFRPLRDFAKYGARLAKASAAGDRIIDLFEARLEVTESPDATVLTDVRGGIEFRNVHFAYEPGKTALRGVDLVIEPYSHVAIVGPSGSGKSTLASLVLRLHDPTEGKILLDGANIRDVTVDSLRGCISTVLQDTVLFAGSIRDNIVFGIGAADQRHVEAASRLANAHDFISELPQGYDTLLGERGVNLSNGQRQRIAIARAAMRDAPILILDEPTTGLDPENERIVLEALTRLSKGRTTLHITHRIDAARLADRILVIREGALIEDGSHAQLAARRGFYTALLNAPDGNCNRHASSR